MSDRVVIVGAGVGGLAAALALGRQGHQVTLLERDPLPAAADAEEAFVAPRRGAPQVHHPHGFLARVGVEMRKRFPDVFDDLCAVCPTRSWIVGEPLPGDEDLVVLAARRTTFDWVFRRAVLAEPGVEVRTAARVVGLTRGDGASDSPVPVIDGVRLHDGSRVAADVVVAATGKSGLMRDWLSECGVEVAETETATRSMYLTRWYRVAPGSDLAELGPRLIGDYGFGVYLAIPGDAGTLSVTLAIPPDDRELRAAISDPDRFERACRMLPGLETVFNGGALEPYGPVRPMGGQVNRIRRFLDDRGEPTVLGFHAVGDAHTCTNPLYGRGCALALVQADLLAEADAAHPRDPVARAVAYEAASAHEVEPWYHASVSADTGASGLLTALGGLGGVRPAGGARPGLPVLLETLGADPVVVRAVLRVVNVLALPGDLFNNPELTGRMAAMMARYRAAPPPAQRPLFPPRPGPSRSDLLEWLSA